MEDHDEKPDPKLLFLSTNSHLLIIFSSFWDRLRELGLDGGVEGVCDDDVGAPSLIPN